MRGQGGGWRQRSFHLAGQHMHHFGAALGRRQPEHAAGFGPRARLPREEPKRSLRMAGVARLRSECPHGHERLDCPERKGARQGQSPHPPDSRHRPQKAPCLSRPSFRTDSGTAAEAGLRVRSAAHPAAPPLPQGGTGWIVAKLYTCPVWDLRNASKAPWGRFCSPHKCYCKRRQEPRPHLPLPRERAISRRAPASWFPPQRSRGPGVLPSPPRPPRASTSPKKTTAAHCRRALPYLQRTLQHMPRADKHTSLLACWRWVPGSSGSGKRILFG